MNQRQIYFQGRIQQLSNYTEKLTLRRLFGNTLVGRTFLAAIFKPKPEITELLDDQSVYEFLVSNRPYWNKEDEDFLIRVMEDSNLRAVYGGDINKLSARSCKAYSEAYNLTHKKLPFRPFPRYYPDTDDVFMYLDSLRSLNYRLFRFKGGWDLLNAEILKYLKKSGVKIIKSYAKSISSTSPTVTLVDGSRIKSDHILSTVNSKVLAQLFPSITSEIEHKSWGALHLGYKSAPPMKGFGYTVPTIENQHILSVIYNYNAFPKNAPTVTVFGYGTSEELLSEFQRHTGFTDKPDACHYLTLQDSVPQYEIGHYIQQMNMSSNCPKWLHIAGHSFEHSGIPGCVIRAKDAVDNIIESITPKTLKSS